MIDGLEADVVTLALWADTNQIAKAGLMAQDWETRLPNNSLPYTSTIVFVVRKGNPKGIKDWPDIVKPGVEIVTPNPKTSGNGKLSFLAAWGSVKSQGGSDADALEFVKKLYEQTPVLDLGARGSTTTFVQKKIGDVHLAWENEAHLEVQEANGEVEIVYPPTSILAEPHVALVDKNVERKGTADVAKAYLEFLYTPEGQEIIAKNYYRPSDPAVLAKYTRAVPGHQALRHHRRRQELGRRHGQVLRRRRRLRQLLQAQVSNREHEQRGNVMTTDVNRRVLPGFALSLGYTMFYLIAGRAGADRGGLLEGVQPLARRLLGGGVLGARAWRPTG